MMILPSGKPQCAPYGAGRTIPLSLKPTRRRELTHWIRERFAVSVQQARRLAMLRCSTPYRRSRARDQTPLRMRIRELAMTRPRFGHLRIHVLLRREGWAINRKRAHRLYRLEGLQERMRGAATQAPEPAPRPGFSADGSESALEHGFRP